MAAEPPQVSVSCPSDTRRWTEPVWQLSDRPRIPSARSLLGLCRTQRWQVAAALSAAVTTTKRQGTVPNSQAEAPMQKQPRQTPAALREGARGRGKTAIAASGG